METRQILVNLPKSWYLELRDIADRHVIGVEDFSAQILLTFIVNYRKANNPLMTDVHKLVEDKECPSTPTNVSDVEPKQT